MLAFLLFGNVVYQLERIGYLSRLAGHRPVPQRRLTSFEGSGLPPLVTLVPSYREEPQVVAQTLLSAALQRYPNRVVLLIDDPPAHDPEGQRALDRARLLPIELQRYLERPASRVRAANAGFHDRMASGGCDRAAETIRLAGLWDWISGWFMQAANDAPVTSRTDSFFAEHILRAPGREAANRGAELRALVRAAAPLDEAALRADLTGLRNRFSCDLTSFERKRFVNLSHEPNKAMNLNTYIGLMGQSWDYVERSDGVHLVASPGDSGDLVVPGAAYVITLDADSLLAPDYALRLAYEMEQPENQKVAVMQTPYCAIPNPAGTLERIAGATTDIQHLLHQGSSTYGATYWVGANALVRRSALDDVRTLDWDRGFPVARYIQDRTVIEDTESSIDLVHAGWQLHNYPDRLAVSATPPDFGALVIQRRRWANGGLIILPKLFRYLFARPRSVRKIAETTIRFHYLSSIAAVNIGLLVLLSYSFPRGSVSPWLPLLAAPYFLLYARDLSHLGYRSSDVVRVYALNLALVPINLAGVAKSIHQATTRTKVPFARTPKVADRTRVPARYVVFELAMLGSWSVGAAGDALAGRWGHAAFGLANIALLAYGLAAFIGVRPALADLMAPLSPRPRLLPRGAADADPGPLPPRDEDHANADPEAATRGAA
ncbi:MAG TPA: glycosyltransferase family 2 protein [Actinomycetota bacterium]|nr:glycosyltransferase family 2 protein [Actinomycetota bacterium]